MADHLAEAADPLETGEQPGEAVGSIDQEGQGRLHLTEGDARHRELPQADPAGEIRHRQHQIGHELHQKRIEAGALVDQRPPADQAFEVAEQSAEAAAQLQGDRLFTTEKGNLFGVVADMNQREAELGLQGLLAEVQARQAAHQPHDHAVADQGGDQQGEHQGGADADQHHDVGAQRQQRGTEAKSQVRGTGDAALDVFGDPLIGIVNLSQRPLRLKAVIGEPAQIAPLHRTGAGIPPGQSEALLAIGVEELDRQGEQIDHHQADRRAPEGTGAAAVEGVHHGAVALGEGHVHRRGEHQQAQERRQRQPAAAQWRGHGAQLQQQGPQADDRQQQGDEPVPIL